MPAPGHEIGRRNRERVREYFATHVGAKQNECAKALDLSVMVVNRHIQTLRKEWSK